MTARGRLDPRIDRCFFGGFKELRPAQEDALVPLLEGRDVIISSGTGTGKTEAALAPLLSRYWQEAIQEDCLVILYIAPTKALANDLERRLCGPLRCLGLHAGIRHGDRDDLSRAAAVHVLITTPESLEVLLGRKDAALDTVRAVILDEVHLLYNTQRGLQLSMLLRRLDARIARPPLQKAALSATAGRPEDVWRFLFGSASRPEVVSDETTRSIDAKIYPGDKLNDIVRQLYDRPCKVLLFANSRYACEQLVAQLGAIPDLKVAIFAHYSSLSPEVRLHTEHEFGRLDRAICVTTSTLELGIDIGSIDCVLLWGMPATIESFLQRIGRGNRRKNKVDVLCFVPATNQNGPFEGLMFLALVLAGKAGAIPPRSPMELYGAIVQQCLCIIHSAEDYTVRATELISRMDHLGHLTAAGLRLLLDEVTERGYLVKHGFKNRYGPSDRLHELVARREIYGNFAQTSRSIKLVHRGEPLGDVPSDNLKAITKGDCVRFAGRYWHVTTKKIDRLELEPAPANSAAKHFKYGGSGIVHDAYLFEVLWTLIHSADIPFHLLSKSLREAAVRTVNSYRDRLSYHNIPTSVTRDGFRYHTFAGRQINTAIARWAGQPDARVDDAYLVLPDRLTWSDLPTKPEAYVGLLESLPMETEQLTLFQNLLPASLLQEERLQRWLKDDTVRIVLERLQRSAIVQVPDDF